jgi:hypothetical protein
VPGLVESFGWGHLKDHPEPCDECSATGENEDGDECDVCGGACVLRWGSFYGNEPRGECEYCKAQGVVVAAMYEGGDGREWVCLPCYLTHHKESCGCALWREAEDVAAAQFTRNESEKKP